MKLLRHGTTGAERPGFVDPHGAMRDLSGMTGDFAGDVLDPANLRSLSTLALSTLASSTPAWDACPLLPAGTRIGPCVGQVGKFICVGLNYADHAAETGASVPAEPILFMKATSAIAGPDDDLPLPRGSEKTDWEVELGVVIGRIARHVSEREAMDHVAGFCVVNDYSERAWQLEGTGQWMKGKGCDGFGPIGPWLVTVDDSDAAAFDLWLDVNDARMQTGSTRTMVFGPAFLVSYISRFMTLHPGDIISTGTPPGVGLGMSPPRYLTVGDIVTLGISGLGSQRQRIVAAR